MVMEFTCMVLGHQANVTSVSLGHTSLEKQWNDNKQQMQMISAKLHQTVSTREVTFKLIPQISTL